MKYGALALLLGGMLVFSNVPAGADELAQAARAVLAAQKPVVITIRLTQKQKMTIQESGTQEMESVNEVTGTVIDPSGLVVASLSATDPSQLMQQMMGGQDDSGFKIEVELTKITMLFEDGKEIEAQVVLRDKDLDLAFIRPTAALEKPLACLDLAKSAKPDQFDPLILPKRLGKVANRAYSAAVARVEAIIEKPRTLYVLGMQDVSPGTPAFLSSGECAGIAVVRSIAPTDDSDMGFYGNQDPNVAIVVLPGADVLEIAKQAPAKAAETPQPATAAPAPEAAAPASVVIPNPTPGATP